MPHNYLINGADAMTTATKKTAALTYTVSTARDLGYAKTTIRVTYSTQLTTMADARKGCTADNWGEEYLAKREGILNGYQAAGVESWVEYDGGSSVSFELVFQHNERSESSDPFYWCQASIELPKKLSEARKAMEFIEKIGAAIEKAKAAKDGGTPNEVHNYTFSNPAQTIAAIETLRLRGHQYSRPVQVDYNPALQLMVPTDSTVGRQAQGVRHGVESRRGFPCIDPAPQATKEAA